MFSIYLINKTESPALSLFAPTNKLHPVVRRCRFGWPRQSNIIDQSQEIGNCLHITWNREKLLSNSPRYIWRNVHVFSCKSRTTSSWFGGCIVKSWNICLYNQKLMWDFLYITYCRWKAFVKSHNHTIQHHGDDVNGSQTSSIITIRGSPKEERVSPLPFAALRIHHGYLYHLQSKFCRKTHWDVYWALVQSLVRETHLFPNPQLK